MSRRMIVVVLIGCLSMLGSVLVGQAFAGTQAKVWISGKTLKIRDASSGSVLDGDFNNDINVKAKRDEGVVYVIDANGTLIVGPGCTAGSFVEDTSAGRPEDLWAPQWFTYEAKCPLSGLKKIDVNSGAGDDSVQILLSPIEIKLVGGEGADDLEYWSCDPGQVVPYFTTKSTINGGLGDDYLVGGRGPDTIIGARGYDWVEGTCGADRLSGGGDGDNIIADETNWCDMDCAPSRDVISCGDGFDGVTGDSLDVYSPKLCENVDIF
jgi:Ca2+-binding RTX toxin-like protein